MYRFAWLLTCEFPRWPSIAQDKMIPRQLCACKLRMTVASNGVGTCSPTSKLTTQSARGSASGIVRSNQLTKPSVYSSTFPAPSYAIQSRSGSSLRSRCPYWPTPAPKSFTVVLRAKPKLAHSSASSSAFHRKQDAFGETIGNRTSTSPSSAGTWSGGSMYDSLRGNDTISPFTRHHPPVVVTPAFCSSHCALASACRRLSFRRHSSANGSHLDALTLMSCKL
mmetsp:Transcript_13785/g.34325  ORF Transcript_13785/g.34325 Transcript_13785/m.34325 type:complete len:223 (+) Transcript_13785:172-840(+)